MARTKNIDPAQAIIERILGEPVPSEGQLKHPLATKPRQKGVYQHTAEVLLAQAQQRSEFPTEVAEWTTRHFVDYTAKRIQEETGGNYKKLYRADIGYIQQIQRFMASNGLAKNDWTRNFIEWCLLRRAQIVRKDGFFTIQVLPRYLNQFMQEEIMPQVERGAVSRDQFDTSLLEEIEQAVSEGKATEVVVRFGIPVAVTYFVKVKGFGQTRLIQALHERFNSMVKSGAEGHLQVSRVFQASVLGSPYPADFLALNWRVEFADLVKIFEGDSWYRPDDYKGRPLGKYDAILGRNTDATEPNTEA